MRKEELLTTGRAAKALGVTINTIKSWIRKGKLGALRLPSGHYRVPRSELEKILESGEHGAARVSPTSRSQAWREYEAWRGAQPRVHHRLPEVLEWVDSMLRLARSRGPLPEVPAEDKVKRIERLHRTLARVGS